MIESGQVVPQREQRGTAPTTSVTFYEDGEAVDPGTVTVGITDQAGNIVRAPGQATTGTTNGPRNFALSAADLAELGRLTITWSSPTKGDLVTYVEVGGGFLFTLAEARADSDLIALPIADLILGRTLAETALEDACGRAFVPRYARETLTPGAYRLALARQALRLVRSASIGGTDLTEAQLADLRLDGRSVYYSGGWGFGVRDVVIEYEHGEDYPPPRVSRACLLLAKNWIIDGPIDERATALSAGDAGGTINLLTPGTRGSTFGIPEVDEVVNRYRRLVQVG